MKLVTVLVLLAVVTASFARTATIESAAQHRHGVLVGCVNDCAQCIVPARDASTCGDSDACARQHACSHIGASAAPCAPAVAAAVHAGHGLHVDRPSFFGTVSHDVPIHPPRVPA